MAKNMAGRVVVITGASSGIGKATAIRFARAGARLVLAARRKNLLESLADECEKLGAEAVAVQADVTDEGDVQKLAKTAISEYGRIDVWVNDAGVSTFGRFDEVPMKEHERVIETDLLGVMYGANAAIRQFRKQGHGTLINVGSMLSKHPAPYQASYVAAKHAVRGLGAALRQELWANDEKAIHVCTVMPVSMDTPFFQHAANHTDHPVKAIPPVYPPEQVADTIFEMAVKPREEAIVGRSGKFINLQQKFAPWATEKEMAYFTHKSQTEQQKTASAKKGNLFSASKEGSSVRGGWLDPGKKEQFNVKVPEETPEDESRSGVNWGVILGIAFPTAVGALLLRRVRSERQQLAA